MTDESIEYWFSYWGPYVVQTRFKDPTIVTGLLEKALEQRKDTGRFQQLDARANLAGQIDEELWYENYNDWFVPKFAPYVNLYLDGLREYKPDSFEHIYSRQAQVSGNWKAFQATSLPDTKLEWVLDSLWVNFQKPREYNPPHHHTGDMSFVLFLQVPEGIKKENEAIKGVHNNEGPGMLIFDYGEHIPFSIGRKSLMPVVGDLIMFPSWLRHYVNDFTSKGERISVSGNVTLRVADSEFSEYGFKP